MRFLLRWTFRIAVFVVVLVVALILFKDVILETVVERNIEKKTGLDAKIGTFELGFLSPTLTFKELSIQNGAEFGEGTMLDVRDFHIKYDRTDMALGKLRLPVMRLHLEKLHIVEAADGRNNFAEFMKKLKETSSGNRLEELDFEAIDRLELTVREIQYTNLKDPSRNWRKDLGIEKEVVRDVRQWSDLQGVLLKVLVRQGLDSWFSR